MAKVFADASSDVTIHARRPGVVAEINVRHQNARYLPDVVLPDRLRATADPSRRSPGPGMPCCRSRRRRCGRTSPPGPRTSSRTRSW
ncbi:hypothetical protein ACFVYV_47390 [Streptomyces mirabilis]|uniref:hypothetical protein n=1 Tax=Streptomyces mirabilis TaxID=68239 RepID=UPI0036DB0848